MIELFALGTAEIHTDSRTVTPSQTVAFAAGLYLIMERGKPVMRTRLESLLWPDARRKVQNHRLRQTIYQLKTLGITPLADRNVVQLPQDYARTDVDDFVTAGIGYANSPLEFLPGYAPHLSDGFQEWLDTVRENVHSAITRALLPALREFRNAGSWGQVENISKHCLRLDPYNEAAVLAQAEAFAMRGQKAAALAILDRFVKELGPNNPNLVLPATVLRRRVLQNDTRPPVFPAAASEPDFVGRGQEMSVLTQFVESARKGDGSGCLIDGQPGIGKTRLCSEVAKFADLQGLRVERVACKRSDAHQPLSAFVSLVPRLRELSGALGCSQESLVWLRRLTEFDTSSRELAPPSEDSATIYTHLRSAVFDLLDAVSDERSLLVIVEDVQWLDRASAILFGAILEWVPSKKILFLFNSRETTNTLTDAISAREIKVIHLKPLKEIDAVALVRTMIATSTRSLEELRLAWLINAGEGNPYLLQELAKEWMESGQRHEVPPPIATVLDERLGRLSDIARQLLQACAVFAENANLDRLERALLYGPQDLLMGIQELSASGMLRCPPPGEPPTQSLIVRHDLLSIQALKSLAPNSLAYIHRRCAVVLELEALGTSVSTSVMRACAFHWHHSGDSERAYGLAIKCAAHLLEIGLAAEAAQAFEGALAFCFTLQRKLDVLTQIVHANRMARDWHALLSTITRIRALEITTTSGVHHDDLELAELEARKTTETELNSVFARTLGCVYETSLPPAHRVGAAAVSAKLATVIPDLIELERVYRVVSPLLEDPAVSTRTRLQLQVIYNTMCGDLRQAVSFARERVVFERAEGTISLLINAMTDLAFALRRAGPSDETFDVLREAYATAVEHKYYASARDCADKIASMLEDDEDPDSTEWMRLASHICTESRDIRSDFSLNADATRIALRENRLDDARQLLETGFDWEWLSHRGMWLAAATGLRIRLLIAERSATSEVARHIEQLKQVYARIAGLGQQDYEIAALGMGLIYIAQPSEAKKYLDDYMFNRRRDLTPRSNELIAISRSLEAVQISAQICE